MISLSSRNNLPLFSCVRLCLPYLLGNYHRQQAHASAKRFLLSMNDLLETILAAMLIGGLIGIVLAVILLSILVRVTAAS